MTRILLIECCEDCPHCRTSRYYKRGYEAYCTLVDDTPGPNNTLLSPDIGVQTWCPLPAKDPVVITIVPPETPLG